MRFWDCYMKNAVCTTRANGILLFRIAVGKHSVNAWRAMLAQTLRARKSYFTFSRLSRIFLMRSSRSS